MYWKGIASARCFKAWIPSAAPSLVLYVLSVLKYSSNWQWELGSQSFEVSEPLWYRLPVLTEGLETAHVIRRGYFCALLVTLANTSGSKLQGITVPIEIELYDAITMYA